MKILVLRSSFQTDEFVEKEYAPLLNLLRTDCRAEILILGDEDDAINKLKANDLVPDIVMTATGGVENLFTRIMPVLGNDVRIIADGRNNSLAAALEILSYLRNNGRKGTIIHGSVDEIAAAVKASKNPLAGVRIARFGKPSDWLIASDVDTACLAEKYGVETVDIDMQRLIDGLAKVPRKEATQVAREMVRRAASVKEPSCADMLEAAKVYLAIKSICRDENINALTIRCFDMVKACRTTSCLALALLNDEGIVAGCEGDMQTLLTMVLVRKLCGEPSFMANPSQLTDTESMFAHCTIPASICGEVVLRSHFESSLGVALQGDLPEDAYTILKWGGVRLDKYFVAEAVAAKMPYSEHYCRTQITLNINMKPYLLNKTIGNHHVIVRGRHADAVRAFMAENGVEEV